MTDRVTEEQLKAMSEAELEDLMHSLAAERDGITKALVSVCNEVRAKAHVRQVRAQANATNDNPNKVRAV